VSESEPGDEHINIVEPWRGERNQDANIAPGFPLFESQISWMRGNGSGPTDQTYSTPKAGKCSTDDWGDCMECFVITKLA
jgi:hypothetical protein